MEKLTEISPENGTADDLARHFSATLDWWRDAGVDCEYQDEPFNWLEGASSSPPISTPTVADTPKDTLPPHPSILPDHLPTDLDEFLQWWLDPESPLPAAPGPRLAPRGDAGAPMMVLAPMPELDDRKTLLSGPQGQLLANIMGAIGVGLDGIYLATALPSHITLPDWDALQRDGLGHALMRHIELAKPQRIIIFGSKLPALLGHSAAASAEEFSAMGDIPVFTTFAPDRLLDHPRQRARLWQRLLQWNI